MFSEGSRWPLHRYGSPFYSEHIGVERVDNILLDEFKIKPFAEIKNQKIQLNYINENYNQFKLKNNIFRLFTIWETLEISLKFILFKSLAS